LAGVRRKRTRQASRRRRGPRVHYSGLGCETTTERLLVRSARRQSARPARCRCHSSRRGW
jgi:hypothetical protein